MLVPAPIITSLIIGQSAKLWPDFFVRCGKEAIILTSWTLKNPGRPNKYSPCPFISWYDLRCQRCVGIIPGLLRSKNNLQDTNKRLEVANAILNVKLEQAATNSKKMKKFLVLSLIGFILYLMLF